MPLADTAGTRKRCAFQQPPTHGDTMAWAWPHAEVRSRRPIGAWRTLGMEDQGAGMMKHLPMLVAAALAAVSSHAGEHGGGLNAEGCHHDRKTGDYHCHRAQAAPSPPPTSLASGAQTARDAEHVPASPGSPTCHVGPRGGTYTITGSGRKNYAGC